MNIPNPGNSGEFLNTITFPELYDIVDKNFTTLRELVPEVAEQLFIVEDAKIPSPNMVRYDEYDVDTFAARKPEAQGTIARSFGIGYSVTAVPLRFGKKAVVTKEDRLHGKDREVSNSFVSLSSVVAQRKELDLTHVITFCTATSYTNMEGETITTSVGDGLALASAVHKLKHSATTYSNRASGDPLFAPGSADVMEGMTKNQIMNNFGERRVINFNVIFCADTPSVYKAIKRHYGSSSDDTQNNSGVMNVDMGKYKLVVLPYLATSATGAYDSTKKNWWGMISTSAGSTGNRWQAYIRYWERPYLVSPEEGNTKNGDNDTWEFHTRGYYSIRVVSPRGFLISCPTS